MSGAYGCGDRIRLRIAGPADIDSSTSGSSGSSSGGSSGPVVVVVVVDPQNPGNQPKRLRVSGNPVFSPTFAGFQDVNVCGSQEKSGFQPYICGFSGCGASRG